MALVYKSICYEADSNLLQLTKLTEKEIRYKVEIEKLMNTGYISIAKARYIMGSTCVTKMQLPSDVSNPIKPLATVCRAEKNNHWVFHIHRKDSNNDQHHESVDIRKMSIPGGSYNESFNSRESNIKPYEEAFKNLLQNDPKLLKKSKNAYTVDDKLYKDLNDELLDEMSTDSDSTGSVMSVNDPIRLFGILVPNALKQAQSRFKEVINLVAKCATLQSELSVVLHRYNHLIKVKNLIEMAAKDTKMEITKPVVYWTPVEVSYNCFFDNPEEGNEEDGESEVSVQKSIRSVFYVQPQDTEADFWESDSANSLSEDK